MALGANLSPMINQYRRLAVFVDNPSQGNFLWVVIESTDDPAVWLDLETGDGPYDSWIDAYDAGNEALMAYVDDELIGPVKAGQPDEDASEDE
ncbi:MAG: hypothetical protein NVS2B4_12020 [Ramlibacter sp.]